MKITRRQLRELILQEYRRYKGKGDNPCWKGFSPGAQTGKKTKKGKSGRVANCERIKEEDVEEQTLTDYQDDPYKYGKTAADALEPISEPDLYRMQQMREGDPAKGTGKKPKRSGRRLYTDENPKDTVRIKFATVKDAKATVAKVKRVRKSYARKIQILTVGEQRAKVMGKKTVASVFKQGKTSLRNARNKRVKRTRTKKRG